MPNGTDWGSYVPQSRVDAIEALAEYLHWTLERYDPTDDPNWSDLTDHQKDIYRATIRQILCRTDLLPLALGAPSAKRGKELNRYLAMAELKSEGTAASFDMTPTEQHCRDLLMPGVWHITSAEKAAEFVRGCDAEAAQRGAYGNTMRKVARDLVHELGLEGNAIA